MNQMASSPTKSESELSRTAALPRLPDIPRGRYVDEGMYQAEMEHIFKKTWHFAGHTSDFPDNGSYRELDLPFAPVFVLRDRDGQIRAFRNACAHRGGPLLRTPEGRAKTLTCQYHGWTYDLSGKLIKVTDPESFQSKECEKLTLTAVRCETWGSMVFINLDESAPPLLQAIAPFLNRWSHIAEAPLRLIKRSTRDVNCNWKIVAEAFRESYHVDMTHRASVAHHVIGNATEYHALRNGLWEMIIPYKPVSNFESGALLRELTPLPGAATERFMRNMIAIGFFPTAFWTLQYGGFPIIQIFPLSIEKSRLSIAWYGMAWDNDQRPAAWDMILPGFDQIVDEDIGNMEAMQRSYAAETTRSMPLSNQEVLVYQLHAEIDRALGADNVPVTLRVGDALSEVLAD